MSEEINECSGVLLAEDVKGFVESEVLTGGVSVNVRPFSVSENPYVQLLNGRDFAVSQPHGKFAFKTMTGGGYCVRGFLLGGNGVHLKPGVNYGYPFHGMAADIYDNPVDLTIFREADDALAKVLGGDGNDVMQINDNSTWFSKEMVVAMFNIAMEDFPLTAEGI